MSLSGSLLFITVVHWGLELFLKILDFLKKLFELKFSFTFGKLNLIALLSQFFIPRWIGFLSEIEFFHEGFLLLKWVDNTVDLGFSGFYCLFKGDKDLFLFFVSTQVDVNEFVFFDELLCGFDVFFLHFGDVNFGILD